MDPVEINDLFPERSPLEAGWNRLELPPKGELEFPEEVDFKHLVIVGANGSGKTRFGSWIEEKNLQKTHRIAAQKSLSLPREVSPKSLIRAEKEFLYGSYYEALPPDKQVQRKPIDRWGSNPNTFLLNDYEKLMVLLHTEEYEKSLDFKEGRLDKKPFTKLDRVKQIWRRVISHRSLSTKAGVIEATPLSENEDPYNASEMSDGERVLFYLAGEVICAPDESLIIIDEPEMHLHPSIAKTFFDLVQEERPDCSFIYLTHNIDFASSRSGAKKIWIKSFDGKYWEYEILLDAPEIPQNLYLELLGSRKPILFIEGTPGNIDHQIYSLIFPEKMIKPIGSCEDVIQTIKSFKKLENFHHIESFGIIDRDRLLQTEVNKRIDQGIWVLDVAEAENLLLIEDVVKSVAKNQQKDPEKVFGHVKQKLIQFFKNQLEKQTLLHFKNAVKRALQNISDFQCQKKAEALDEINLRIAEIDMNGIFQEIESSFHDAANNNDYKKILKLFNLKNALIPRSEVCEQTGLANQKAYKELIFALLKKNNDIGSELKGAIKAYILTTSNQTQDNNEKLI